MRAHNSNDRFSNIEIITLAVFLLGGESNYIDTEDIAVKVNELAPGRFTWRKYPHQINIDNVRKRLSDAKNPRKGGYVAGSFMQGWILTEMGLKFCKSRVKDLQATDISRPPLDKKEIAWRSRERMRMFATAAYEKFMAEQLKEITPQEAEAFFRLDDYVTGEARERKIDRIINTFSDEPELNQLIKLLAERIRENDRRKNT